MDNIFHFDTERASRDSGILSSYISISSEIVLALLSNKEGIKFL